MFLHKLRSVKIEENSRRLASVRDATERKATDEIVTAIVICAVRHTRLKHISLNSERAITVFVSQFLPSVAY